MGINDVFVLAQLPQPVAPWPTPGLPELAILLFILLFFGALGVLPIIAYWKIFSKAGFSGWLALTQLIPLVGLVILFYVAFTEWPAQRGQP